jgi:hypothetical protein
MFLSINTDKVQFSMGQTKTSLEQKATNKDLEAQALVSNKISNGIFVFQAQGLLKENEELFLKKKYSKIFRNIQRIKNIVEREEVAVVADRAQYHEEWLLLLMKTLMKQKGADLARKVNRDIESIGLALETKDFEAAIVGVNKAVGEAMGLPKETLLDWFRNTVVDLNEKVDELLVLMKGKQDKFKFVRDNPMDILRNYLEEIMTLISYEDIKSVKEPIERSYSYIWQIRRFLEQYVHKKMPEDLAEMKENIVLDLYRFSALLKPFSKKYEVDKGLKSVTGKLKRIQEDYCEGFITRKEAMDELIKSQDLAEKKKDQVHEDLALKVIARIQKRIDTVKSWDMDASLSQSIYNQLTEAYGRKDYEKAQALMSDLRKSLTKKRKEKLKKSALSLINPVESFIESVEEQGVDVGEARTLLTMALDHVEKNEFDMVERLALEAKEKAEELRKMHFSGEIGKVLKDLKDEITLLKEEGRDTSKVEINLRQASMMVENNNMDKAKEYIEMVKEEIDNLQLDLKTPPPPPGAPKAKPKRKLTPEEVEKEKVLLGQITTRGLEMRTIERYYADITILEKILDKARQGMDAYEFKRTEKLLKKFDTRSKSVLLDGMKKMLAQVKLQGVETDYLEFVLQQTSEAIKKGEDIDEYLKSLKESLKDFRLPGEDDAEEEDTSKCPKCGNDITEEDAFCSKCGQKLT